MQNLYNEVATLDQRCYEQFGLSEDLLMEHAADGMADYIRANFAQGSKVLIASGSGNNGADGITLARLLHKEYDISLYLAKEPKSDMCHLQLERTIKIGLEPVKDLGKNYDVVVDAILGTGFRGVFNDSLRAVLKELNAIDGFKIACDVPSGWSLDGVCEKDTFRADVTLTMGALKRGMYLDEAKDFMGEIHVLDLGVARAIYETPTKWKLLEWEDAKLPKREMQNSHKGSFGHTAVIAGEKEGAGVLSASAALRIGSGLVTLIDCQNRSFPYDLMHSEHLPKNTTAIAIGMGLGTIYQEKQLDEFLDNDIPLVCDADILYSNRIQKLLQRENIILTPHPKEFCALLKVLELADITVDELQKNRFKYVELFSSAYPKAVLLLKGANSIIAYDQSFYINPLGSAKLAKGGSGDVLAGVITGLLAQGYTPLDAAISGSLIHTKLATLYKGADFSLTPSELINMISKL
ncbi:NAD(P)HX epimerase / NAD(P)HX dehydratase [hydrothermal vent metagenome]|uniref:Nicotinamide nucleotide repair protein n=1 Tax=hydrothermal vent metagenome TaxID=652676 RepID=A0A1W1BGS0_9ZZZZ